MKAKYILRIDDVCPTMKWDPFVRIMNACLDLGISPIIGVIPDNQDAKLQCERERPDFWESIRSYESQGAIIAQHGYQHRYVTKDAGIVGINSYSEFAGLSYEEQYEKIQRGKKILEERLGTSPTWWMAPAHSLDKTTCKALYDLGFTYITDGISPYPYKQYGMTWVPQQIWSPRIMPAGTWTICIHSNTISEKSLEQLLGFLHEHQEDFKNVSLDIRKSFFTLPMRLLWNIALKLRRL